MNRIVIASLHRSAGRSTPSSVAQFITPCRFFGMERARDCVKIGGSIRENGAAHRVIKITQGKRGKGGGFVKAKLKVSVAIEWSGVAFSL